MKEAASEYNLSSSRGFQSDLVTEFKLWRKKRNCDSTGQSACGPLLVETQSGNVVGSSRGSILPYPPRAYKDNQMLQQKPSTTRRAKPTLLVLLRGQGQPHCLPCSWLWGPAWSFSVPLRWSSIKTKGAPLSPQLCLSQTSVM